MKSKNSLNLKWKYNKSAIQVVNDDGIVKPGFIAPELVCYTFYGQSVGSVDLPDEYNPNAEVYHCRVMVDNGKILENDFDCVKDAINWVESKVKIPEIKNPIFNILSKEVNKNNNRKKLPPPSEENNK